MTDVKILASGFGFPEGPVVMPDGAVILTEIRNGRCSRVTADGKARVFSECGGGPNGLAIGPDGALYLCNNGGGRYVEGTSMSQGAHADYKGGSIQRLDAKTGEAKTALHRVRRPQALRAQRPGVRQGRVASTSPISASATPAIATMAASTTRCPTARRSPASPIRSSAPTAARCRPTARCSTSPTPRAPGCGRSTSRGRACSKKPKRRLPITAAG